MKVEKAEAESTNLPLDSKIAIPMSDVPENQKIEKVLRTCFNDAFAATADALTPALSKWPRRPCRTVKFGKDSSTYFGITPKEAKSIDELSISLWGRGDEFVVDFGIHMVGTVSFLLEAEGLNIDAPCRLRLTFGESPIDVVEDMSGVNTWISTSWLPDEVINVDFMPETVVLPRRYSFRFLRVQIVDTSPKYKVKFRDIICNAVSAVRPDTVIDTYDFKDPLLQSIDCISIFTLRDCMQTVFEDGPRRDRRLWIGDLRLQALANYHTFKDYKLVKRCLYLFAALMREDDSLPACLFEKPRLTPATDYIVDYDALFGAIVHDYVVASGDFHTGRELWPTIQGSLKRALAHVNSESHLFVPSRGTGWKFLDWADDLDTSAGMHGLLIYCLRSVHQLAKLISVPSSYEITIAKMSNAATIFIDEQTSLFVSGSSTQVSHASAAWLTLSGALPVEKARKALKATLLHPAAIQPLTPYLYHHVVDALISVELFTEAVDLLKSYWGGMVKAGADTFWECFDRSNSRTSPYGDVRNNSFCHAWSCTPTYLLRARLIGFLGAERTGEVSMEKLDQDHIQRTCRPITSG